ncbi:MAG: 2-oxo acid dehydrogenase subunit E2, partial [Proteobacteria bacterium]|nr:2-oxo acid dehydrogenase subunit E2 [Pseudomonadota bacterium]
MIEIKVPEAGESVKEAMIGSWLVKDGDFVNQDDPMVELETDKASMEIVAEVSGVITLIAKEQDIVQVGQVIAKLAPQSATPNQPVSASETKSPHTHPSQQGEKTEVNQQTTEQTSRPQSFSHHGPAVDVMAAAAGIDATQLKDQGITGSGKEGRLTKGDMLDLITDSHHHQPKQSTNNNADERRSEKQPLSMMRRRIAERLLHATQQTAMLTTFNEVDMSAIINIRQKYKETFLSTHNVKLGFMSFFLRASVLALGKFPKVNAYIEDGHLVSHNYMDVGVAVASGTG